MNTCVCVFAEKSTVSGEVLDLIRISRTEMGAYLCIAQNGVPPSVSKRIILTVECEYLTAVLGAHLFLLLLSLLLLLLLT